MGPSSRSVLSQLQEQGFRLTKSRKGLIEYILSRKGHWTIQDLVTDCRKSLPGIGVATIYRTVGLLAKQKALSENRMGGAATRYEVAHSEHHDHLTCIDCGELFEFENTKIETLQEKVASDLGFKLVDHRMELYAQCVRSQCKNRDSKARQKLRNET